MRRFLGHERIELDVITATSSIVCNADELQISNATLSRPDGPAHRVDLDISFDEDLERVSFTAPDQVSAGFATSSSAISPAS